MKAYRLDATEREMSLGSLSVLVLGERGRGMVEKLIHCPENIEDGDLVSLGKTRTGRAKILKQDDGQNNKWLAHISTEGAYIRGAYGHIEVSKWADVELVELGYGAFGDAGRVGRWYDYLVVVPDNTVVKVKPSRGKAYFLVFTSDKVHWLTDEELELFLDANDDFVYGDWEVVDDNR